MLSRRLRPSLFLAFTLALTALAACKKTPIVETGKLVKINYVLSVDGKVIESSEGKPPLPYIQGNHQIIPGLEEALMGSKVGDKKHLVIPPEKGYGPVHPEALQKMPRTVFPKDYKLSVGMHVTGQNNGRPVQAKVVALTPTDVTLDLNHPLAGKTLTFDVEVVEISPAPQPANPAMPAPHT